MIVHNNLGNAAFSSVAKNTLVQDFNPTYQNHMTPGQYQQYLNMHQQSVQQEAQAVVYRKQILRTQHVDDDTYVSIRSIDDLPYLSGCTEQAVMSHPELKRLYNEGLIERESYVPISDGEMHYDPVYRTMYDGIMTENGTTFYNQTNGIDMSLEERLQQLANHEYITNAFLTEEEIEEIT